MSFKQNVAKYLFVLSAVIAPFTIHSADDEYSLKYSMKKVKENASLEYAQERNSLTTEQIASILDRGIELASHTDMITSLSQGGSALFPHATILECGDQIAAVVHASLSACQKTGKNQILLIGVLHSGTTDTLKEARRREINGINIFSDRCRGIFGPGLANEDLLCKEYSLDHFIFLLQHAAQRNRVEPPQVIIRYPNLIHGKPELLAGIEELKELAKESIVVATSDLCHHGVAYGLAPHKAFPISKQGYDFAHQVIKENLRLLSGSDLLAYRQHCIDTLSDSIEVGQILNYLLGPLEGTIHDLRLIDVAYLFEEDSAPAWVAATLVELKVCPLNSGL